METDPGASLDRLIAALRQYQAASAAGGASSAGRAAVDGAAVHRVRLLYRDVDAG